MNSVQAVSQISLAVCTCTQLETSQLQSSCVVADIHFLFSPCWKHISEAALWFSPIEVNDRRWLPLPCSLSPIHNPFSAPPPQLPTHLASLSSSAHLEPIASNQPWQAHPILSPFPDHSACVVCTLCSTPCWRCFGGLDKTRNVQQKKELLKVGWAFVFEKAMLWLASVGCCRYWVHELWVVLIGFGILGIFSLMVWPFFFFFLWC